MRMTTIRVSTETRDRLAEVRDRAGARESAEDVIVRLLDEHAAAGLRERMRTDAAHAAGNAEDLAEVRRVQAELDEISAW